MDSIKQLFFLLIFFIFSIECGIDAQLTQDNQKVDGVKPPTISLDPATSEDSMIIRCQGTNLRSLVAFPCAPRESCAEIQSCVDMTRAQDQDPNDCYGQRKIYEGTKCQDKNGSLCLQILVKTEELTSGLIECRTMTGDPVIDYIFEGMDLPNYKRQLMSKRTSVDIFITVSREDGWKGVPKTNNDTVLYINEVVEVRCYVSGLVSDQKFRMQIVTSNGQNVTVHPVDPDSISVENWGRFFEYKMNLNVTQHMVSFKCDRENYEDEESKNVWSQAQFKFMTRVHQTPKIDKTGNGNLTLNYGEKGHQLNCKAMGPQVVIQWFNLNDQEIKNGQEGYSIQTVKSVVANFDVTLSYLRLPSVTSDMDGYFCRATNLEGTDSFIFHIKVYSSPPRIPAKVKMGDKITYKFSKGQKKNPMLNCSADGVPPPSIQWMHNGQIVNDNNFVSNSTLDKTDSFITTRGMVHEDLAGSYTCEAKNFLGNDTIDFVVIVESASNDAIYGFGIAGGIIIIILAIGLLIFWRKYVVTKKQLRSLSEEEVKEFREGNPKMVSKNDDNVIMTNAQALPFDTKYEMPSEDLQIDESSVLGQGQFGIVFKGQYKNVTVAVKTTKPHADVDYFKALLSEVKIMAYVGSHPNIVEFLGAATTKIQERVVHVVVQFCPDGDLHTYLKKNRIHYSDKTRIENDEKARLTNSKKTIRLSKKSLIAWSQQIASGMRYLGEKKVIHSDLAARNVLICDDMVKITDFGLSRQLYSYEKYTKKNKAPLPWRWMSIESLRYLDFSCQSDVWSFGVTIWEIFSLAEVPYPGQQWTLDFNKKLVEGLRLQKPDLATDDIYTVMLKCWEMVPENRPSFDKLEKFFSSALQVVTIVPSMTKENTNYVELK